MQQRIMSVIHVRAQAGHTSYKARYWDNSLATSMINEVNGTIDALLSSILITLIVMDVNPCILHFNLTL